MQVNVKIQLIVSKLTVSKIFKLRHQRYLLILDTSVTVDNRFSVTVIQGEFRF